MLMGIDNGAGGKVTLTGSVDAWHERDMAASTAWAAPRATARRQRYQGKLAGIGADGRRIIRMKFARVPTF